jgi:hypothetical protein
MWVGVLAMQFAPELFKFVVPLKPEGAGVPGARCTRGFVCGSCASKKLHTNIQVKR